MKSGEDAGNHLEQEPMNDNTEETTARTSSRSRSNSSSSDNSMNPSPSLSNSSGTVHKTNWKSPNAFLNYVQDFRQNLRETNKVVPPTSVLHLAGQKWRALPDDQRKIYVDGALAIKRTKSNNITEETKRRKRARARSRVRVRKSSSSPAENSKKKAKRNI